MTFPRPAVLDTTTYKHEFYCGDEMHSFFLRLSDAPDSKELIEAFITIGKAGGCKACWGDGIARLMSFALQDGVKPERIIRAFRGVQCPGSQVGGYTSCLDWIAAIVEKHVKAL